jgi:hypothetical protein
MSKIIKITVENYSVSGIDFRSIYLKSNFPGHSIGAKAVPANIDEDDLKTFQADLKKVAPAAVITVVEPQKAAPKKAKPKKAKKTKAKPKAKPTVEPKPEPEPAPEKE